MKMSCASSSRSCTPCRLGQADLDHLARVVPLVDRRADVEALVALQADQPAAAASRPAPWRSRSCRRRPRLRGTAGGRASARGRARSRARGRRHSRRRPSSLVVASMDAGREWVIAHQLRPQGLRKNGAARRSQQRRRPMARLGPDGMTAQARSRGGLARLRHRYRRVARWPPLVLAAVTLLAFTHLRQLEPVADALAVRPRLRHHRRRHAPGRVPAAAPAAGWQVEGDRDAGHGRGRHAAPAQRRSRGRGRRAPALAARRRTARVPSA